VAWLVIHYGMPRLLSHVYGLTEKEVVTGAFGLIASFQH
jgi:hypothetical protein